MRIKVFCLFLVTLVATGLFFSGPSHAMKEDTIVVAVDSNFSTLAKYIVTNQQIVRLWASLGGTVLYRDGKTNELDPARSQLDSWKRVDDTTWEFTVRKGLTFHTGNPVTSADFKFTFEKAILDKTRKARHRTRYSWITEVKIIDDHTFQIITKKPFPLALDRLSAFSVYDSKYIIEKGFDYHAKHPVGCGPFKFSEWKKGQYITLVAFPDYWKKGYPKTKKLVFKIIPEFATRVAELKSGSVDLITNIDPDKLDQISTDPNLKVVGGPIPRVIFYQFDGSGRASKTPFMDIRVRQAVCHAIDKKKIVETVLRGQGLVVNYMGSPFLFGRNPDQKDYEYNPEKAKALLKEAGYEKGFETDIWQYYGEQHLFNTAAIYYLSKVGIKVNVKDYRGNIGRLVKRRNAGNVTGIGNYSWGTGSIFDMSQFLNLWFTLKSKKNYNPDPDLDAWLEEADNTFDQKRRKELFFKAQQRLHEKAYVMPLFVKYENWGANKKLQLTLPSWGTPRYYEMYWK